MQHSKQGVLGGRLIVAGGGAIGGREGSCGEKERQMREQRRVG